MSAAIWKLGDDPIGDRPTFLAHALTMSLRYGPGPWPAEAGELPDEPPRPANGGLHFPSVVRDGVESHHFGRQDDPDALADVVALLSRLVTGPPDHADLVRLHERLAATSALGIADELIEQIRRGELPGDRLHVVARHLAEYGTRREAVKIGLVLIGACGEESDRELLLLLGALEEFTLYAVLALVRTQTDGQRAVFELARRVQDWGRIHAVERLKDCDDPDIKAWLLRDGFRNGIMNEYLAHLAATTGELYPALLEPDVDAGLLDSAGEILEALAEGGPAEDMNDYPDAVPAMSRWATLLAGREATLGRLNSLLTIHGFLQDNQDEPRWPASLRRQYEELVAESRWPELTLAHLADPDDPRFGSALWAAGRLRLPVLPQITTRLERRPLDDFVWWHAMNMAGPAEAAELTALAARLLPLADLANGPGDHFGFGDNFAADRVLDYVVSGLQPFPGTGLPLIEVALRNRVTRVRNMALRTLSAWPVVPDQALDWVRQAAAVEPNEHTRTDMETFLAGGELS
ncbi:hypothetical protein GCM10009555_057070 [Acrocarpospora macrocephala]|uniref:Limonene hydroxylase n=2 Tax=Acrocarpospora macrocephala TaxID=150177 RepID=A0A5M3WH05_9ACTN|nr:hypothetical protein Amac_020030 [Acrocarpospora macrocephala]